MDFLKRLRDKYMNKCAPAISSGEIVLGYGLHEIKITVDDHPTNVALCIHDPCDGCQVCHGDVNRINVNIMDCGFVICADIKTNTACIQWACELTT